MSLIAAKREFMIAANLLVKTNNPYTAADALEAVLLNLNKVVNGMFEPEVGTFHLITSTTAIKPEPNQPE